MRCDGRANNPGDTANVIPRSGACPPPVRLNCPSMAHRRPWLCHFCLVRSGTGLLDHCQFHPKHWATQALVVHDHKKTQPTTWAVRLLSIISGELVAYYANVLETSTTSWSAFSLNSNPRFRKVANIRALSFEVSATTFLIPHRLATSRQ